MEQRFQVILSFLQLLLCPLPRLLGELAFSDIVPETDSTNNFARFEEERSIYRENENTPIFVFHPYFIVLGLPVQGPLKDIFHKR
jgi:hypothetical protein